MDWDWQFLTPSSTPTATSFDSTSLQTPTLNAHFQDAFSPYLDPHQQMQPSAPPSASSLDFGASSLFPQDNAHPQAQPYAQTFPQQQQQQHNPHPLNSQPAFVAQPPPSLAPAAPIGEENKDGGAAGQNNNIYPTPPDMYQMSTPPPTRGSSTKRRSQRTEPVVFGTPSSIRRSQQPLEQLPTTNHLQQPVGDTSPSKLAHPDLSQPQYHFPLMSSGPPPQLLNPQPNMVFAQPRPTGNMDSAHAWPALEDPFSMPSAAWAQPRAEVSPVRRYSAASGLRRNGSQKSRPLSVETTRNPNYGGHLYGPRQSPEKKKLAPASVDPSLVYSSPSRPATSDSMQSGLSSRPSSSASTTRIPYQHSLKDPRQELDGLRANRFRPPPAQAAAPSYTQNLQARHELQRSNTVMGLRSNAVQALQDSAPSGGMLTRSNSAVNLPRRTSPLKRDRLSRASLTSISETPKPNIRTSIVLTIDSNGRARTETRVVDGSPTKSIRDKYPSLWDDSESDSETPTTRSASQWPSRNSSLSNNRGEERHTKIAKLDPPLEDLENLHLPRSNSSASLASLKTPSKAAYSAAALLRRQSSVKKQQQRPSMQNRRNTLSSLNSSFESLASADSSNNDRSEQSDAGSALREMMASRGSMSSDTQVRPDPVSASARKPAPVAPEQRPLHQKSQSFAAPAPNYGFGRAHFPIECAPMQPPIPSPTQPTNYMAAPIFRCICNLPLDDGRGAVACRFCTMFLHAACLGMDPQRLPTSYICNFCTNSANMPGQNPTQAYAGWGLAGI